MFRSRVFAVSFWLIAVVLAVAAGIWGASIGGDRSPEFSDDGNGVVASSASHVLFEVLGGVLGAAIVIAIASVIWFVLWWRARRTAVEDEDYDMSLDDVDGMFTDEDDDYLAEDLPRDP